MTQTTIFTDGSAIPNPGRAGWAFTVWQGGKEVHHEHGGERRSTNIKMEMTAAIKALEWLRENPQAGTVDLVSDCKLVVNGLNDWRFKWRENGWRKPAKNGELWRQLDALADELKPIVKWQRGHSGNAGNERAHELADRGRTSGNKSNSDVHSISTKQIGNRCRNALARVASQKPGQGLFATLDLHDNTRSRLQAAELLLRHGDISEAVFKSVVDRCQGRNGSGGSLLRSQPNKNALAAALASSQDSLHPR